MTHSIRPSILLVCAIAIIAVDLPSGQGAALPAATQQPPVFKTGVDIVQLDVSVLDAARQPVRGLTADDFVVFEGGQQRPIVGFTPVDVPPPLSQKPVWATQVDPDVETNQRDVARFVVVVMDDAGTGFDQGQATSARRIATAVVNELGPSDRAAVVFTHLGVPENFTTRRRELLAAIDSFTPRNSASAGTPLKCQLQPGGCVLTTLRQVITALRSAPAGRKLVVLIGSSGLQIPEVDLTTALPDIRETFAALHSANITVNGFDPAGLQTFAPTAADASAAKAQGRISAARVGQDGLRVIADNTGGRAVFETNDPESSVASLFREHSSYYLIGFQSADARKDNRWRKVEVKVTRPGLEVRTRRGYFAVASKPADGRASPIDKALASAVPATNVPLSLHVAALPDPQTRETAVFVTAGLTKVRDTGAERVTIVTAAFDGDLRQRGRFQQVFELPRAAAGRDVLFDVYSRLLLKPGRYELRVAAESENRAGSVFRTLQIADVFKEDLALSDLLLQRSPAIAVDGGAGKTAGVTPTTLRVFRQSDRIAAFVRIYQSRQASRGPATITARLVDAAGRPAFDQADVLDSARFAATGSADHTLDLPLSRLPPGEYLLEIAAQASGRNVTKALQFTVQ